MQRFSAIIICYFALIVSVGCSACLGPDDFNYPTYGGIHQRADPARGRVGSIFSDPYANVAGLSADSNLEPYPDPPSNNADTDESDDDEDDFEDDFEREDEDLDDDLENLDSDDLEDIDRDDLDDFGRDDLEDIDRDDLDGLDSDDLDDFDTDPELESIDPLDEDIEPELDGAKEDTTTAARRRIKWRPRR